jgi:hypothetical protein
LAYQWRALKVNPIVRTFRGEAQACSGLLQRRLCLPRTQAEVSRIELCDRLALADPTTQIDSDLTQPTRDFETQHHLILGG